MLEELVIPEELLQLSNLDSAIELCEGTSFFAMLGVDSLELSESLLIHLYKYATPFPFVSNNIFNELPSKHENLYIINLFENNNQKIISNLLFYRDLISDKTLKIILILKKEDYQNILKDAIDLYTITTFNYLFLTYKVDVVKKFDYSEVNKLIDEYSLKKGELNYKQKVSYLFHIAKKYEQVGDIQEVFKYLLKAFKIAKKIKFSEATFEIKFYLAQNYIKIRKLNIAKKYLMELYSADTNNIEKLMITQSLAIVYMHQDDIDQALNNCYKSYTLAIENNNKEAELSILNTFFEIFRAKKDKEKETQYFEESLLLAKNLGDEDFIAHLELQKAIDYLKQRKFDLSLEYLQRSELFYKKTQNKERLIQVYTIFAFFYTSLFDHKKSLIYATECYNYYKKNNYIKELISTITLKASNYLVMGNLEESMKKHLEALKLAKLLDSKKDMVEQNIAISQIYTRQKNYKKALHVLDKVCNLAKKINEFQMKIFARYADIYKEIGNTDKAWRYYYKAESLLEEDDILFNNTYLLELKAEIYVAECKYDDALETFNMALRIANNIDDRFRSLSLEENIGLLYKELKNFLMAKKYFVEVITKLEIYNIKKSKIKELKSEIQVLDKILRINT